MPRTTIIRLVAAMLALTAVTTGVMLQFDWHGVAASEEAAPIDTLLEGVIVLSSLVFAIVIVMLGYSLWRWRAKPGDESDGEPIHGNTRLEIIWTAIPTVIVLVLAAWSWVVMRDIEAREPEFMVVNVTAQQFAWKFQYPAQKGETFEIAEPFESTELHVPVGRQIEFKLHAIDVLHSFWVPEWRIKKDAVPGITTRAVVTPSREGSYALVCAELCGLGHATMRAPVVAHAAKQFDAWVAEQADAKRGEGGKAGGGVAGLPGASLFTGLGCSGCHTLAVAGAKGSVGPNLDEVMPGQSAERIAESIVDPAAEASPGFGDGIMPATYGDQLSEQELDDLVEFLRKAAGK